MATSQKQPATVASTEQLLDIQYSIALALRKMPEAQAKRLLKNKSDLQKLIQRICKELQVPTQNEQAIAAVPSLEEYYKKVFGLDVPEIAETNFPEHQTLKAYMAISPKLPDEDGIMEALQEFFSKKESNGKQDETINLYRWKTPAASNINRAEENKIQQRPAGLYVFAHSGEDEPDAVHRNTSYDDAVAKGMIFAKAKEWLMMTGFHKFTKGYFMDVKGWTRTASLWSDGSLVVGFWFADDSGLYLGSGSRGNRNADFGPRELFL